MGLPTTLAGISGFIIFIVFVVAISASDLYPAQSQIIVDSQNEFYDNLNRTTNITATPEESPGFWRTIFGLVGLDGIYVFITNFFSMLVSFIVLQVGYVFLFFGIAGTIPPEFYLLFAILGMSAIIAILKLIFMSGD